MIDWDFKNAQLFSRCSHLHFQVPAVGLFAHSETGESFASDGAEWAHVGITNSVQYRHQRPGQASGEELLKIHAAGLAFSARARTDHKIMSAGQDRLDHALHKLGAI